MTPKFGLKLLGPTPDGSNDPPAGPPEKVHTELLNAFKASKRNCKDLPSVMRKSLCKPRSASKNFGPVTFPTEQVPKCPCPRALTDGSEMFDGSNHCMWAAVPAILLPLPGVAGTSLLTI